MTTGVLHIPLTDNSLLSQLTDYAEEVIATPNKYIVEDRSFHVTDRPTTNIYDPTIPGVSDDFILNHDLNYNYFINSQGEQLPLEVASPQYQWVYKMALPPFSLLKDAIIDIEQHTQKTFQSVRGRFLYPPTGFMGWHTNSDVPGLRVYMVYASESDKSYFKYVDRTDPANPTIVTSWEKKGWNVRAFNVSDAPETYLWHCIETTTISRLSYGFMFN